MKYEEKINYSELKNLWDGFLIKEKEVWEKEQEFRFITFSENWGKIPYLIPFEKVNIEIVEVVFWMYSNMYRQAVYKILDWDKWKIKFYEMKKDGGDEFAITRKKWKNIKE